MKNIVFQRANQDQTDKVCGWQSWEVKYAPRYVTVVRFGNKLEIALYYCITLTCRNKPDNQGYYIVN